MDFGSLNLNSLIKCTESGEITQRVLAVQTLENLISFGLIQDRARVEQINQLRLLVNINRSEFLSRGAYIVRLLSGEYANQVTVGYTENWDFTYQDIKDTYGAAWLMVFIGINLEEDETIGIEWETWIRGIFKNNPVPYSDKYFINESLMRQFVDYAKDFIDNNNLNVTFSASPLLTLSQKEFGQQAKYQKPIPQQQGKQMTPNQMQQQNPFFQELNYQRGGYQPQYQQPRQQPVPQFRPPQYQQSQYQQPLMPSQNQRQQYQPMKPNSNNYDWVNQPIPSGYNYNSYGEFRNQPPQQQPIPYNPNEPQKKGLLQQLLKNPFGK